MGPEDTRRDPIELRESRSKPGWVEVHAGGRHLGTLTPASITALAIRSGDSATPETAQRVEHRMALELAYKAAGDALARRPMTATELRDRLERRGFDAGIVEETVAALAREGLVNDAEVARQLVREAVSHGGAGAALLEARLAAKGVDADTAKRILEEELAETGSSAQEAAERRARSIPADLPMEAKARRLFAYLARRGFDEHESTEAVRSVLGIESGDPADG